MKNDSEINPTVEELREIEASLDSIENNLDELEEDDEGFVRHEWEGVEDQDDDPLGNDDLDDDWDDDCDATEFDLY